MSAKDFFDRQLAMMRDAQAVNEAEVKVRLVRSEPFILGPLSLAWFTAAGRAGGHALHVGLYLWFLRGLVKANVVQVSTATLAKQWGLGRHTVARAVTKLEKAGLIAVERHKGRLAVATIITTMETK